MKIGVIGLGTMGGPVARNLLRAGFDLTVHDLRRQAADLLIAYGARWAASPADTIDQVDSVVTMVFGPQQIEQVVRGDRGLLAGDCAGKLWIDLTTSSPTLMRSLAAAFESRGGLAVDAPVTGSVDSAIRGDMIMFVGGTDAAVARAQPALAAIGEVRRVGRYGNGYIAKLVNNQLWKIHAAAIGRSAPKFLPWIIQSPRWRSSAPGSSKAAARPTAGRAATPLPGSPLPLKSLERAILPGLSKG